MKLTIIGNDLVEGTAKDTGRPFSFGKIYAYVKLDSPKGKGFMGTDYTVDKELLGRIAHLPVPFDAELLIEDVMKFGKRQSKVVDIRPVGLTPAAKTPLA